MAAQGQERKLVEALPMRWLIGFARASGRSSAFSTDVQERVDIVKLLASPPSDFSALHTYLRHLWSA